MKKRITLFDVMMITTLIIWIIWTLIINGCYAFYAIREGGFDHLVLGEECSFINFIVNSMFVVCFGVATIYRKVTKARKSK